MLRCTYDYHDERYYTLKVIQTRGIDIRFLIHDRDSKFTEDSDEYFSRSDDGSVRTPYQSRVANCFIESWIGSLKRERLNSFFCFSLGQLDHVVQRYALYHNRYRSHQDLGKRPLGVPKDQLWAARKIDVERVRCQHWLGGLLKHYYRKAA